MSETSPNERKAPGVGWEGEFVPPAGEGQQVRASCSPTTYTLKVDRSPQKTVQLTLQVQGVVPYRTYMALYKAPITDPKSGFVDSLKLKNGEPVQVLTTKAPWGGGYYVGILYYTTDTPFSALWTVACEWGPT